MWSKKFNRRNQMIESKLTTKATAELQEEIEKELAAEIPDPPEGAAAALGLKEETDEDTEGDE